MAETPLFKLREHYRELQNDRATWEPFWRDVKTYIVPERGRGLYAPGDSSETNDGKLDDRKRINGTASRALSILANGMQSGLTSKARQWFMLTNPDPALAEYQPVREWYDQVQDILEGVFRRSNLYSSLLHTYIEMAGFGQGAVAILEHPEKTIHCRPYTTGTYYMSIDKWGEIDTFIQSEWLTVRQILQLYPDAKLPSYITNDKNSGRLENRYEVLNAILRHPEQYDVKMPEGKQAASVHFLAKAGEQDGFLRVSGYDMWPVMTPRWDAVDNDVYGQAPTRGILGDAKMLQKMESDALKGTAKSVSPPWRIPPELERRGLNTQPNALNVVASMSEQAVAPLFTSPINIQQLQVKIDRVEQDIKDGLYNSLFLALLTQDNPQMTAREVAERHEEKLLMLGPVLERIHYELLDPLIDRAFSLAWNAGLIPMPPPELRGVPTLIEYVSILSQAQKAVGVNRLEQSVGFLGSMVQVYPELRNALDAYAAYDAYNRMIGVRASIFRPREEYEKMVAEQNRQQQIAQNAAVAEPIANSAKALGEVDAANIRELLSGAGQGGLVL